jgi:hypothetical protein
MSRFGAGRRSFRADEACRSSWLDSAKHHDAIFVGHDVIARTNTGAADFDRFADDA